MDEKDEHLGPRFKIERRSRKATRVLIVDDEEGFRTFVNDLLRENGYDVAEAENGEAALRRIRENRFDVLITDVMMPGMSGLELLRAVKTDFPSTRVIIVTGRDDPEIEKYSMNNGAEDFLTKAPETEKLLGLLISVDYALKEEENR